MKEVETGGNQQLLLISFRIQSLNSEPNWSFRMKKRMMTPSSSFLLKVRC